MTPRVSAIDRLRDLPAIFRVATVAIGQGIPVAAAQVMLSRWTDAGLVKPLGGRTGIYFNLIVAPDGPDELLGEALKIRFPEALLCGPSVLHARGWTTQTPRSIHICVLSRPSLPSLDGIALHPRPRRWFAALPKSQVEGQIYGVPALSPAWAWADLNAFDKGILDASDLDPDRLAAAAEAVERAEESLEHWLSANRDKPLFC